VSHQTITSDRELAEFCAGLAAQPWIAFDTEFVSERTYRPVLCLVQVATAEQVAVVDALAIRDMTPFWQAIATPGHETIVHAGRSELEFCLRAVGRQPVDLFDVQIAAGLVGIEYPASYRTLILKLLGEASLKHETRTDWQRRPLSQRQIHYAVDDARHLAELRRVLAARLDALGRWDWLREEMAGWQVEVEHALAHDRWRRVSGNSGLDRRSLAILRELWRWRESEAERRNCPSRRVLRDDLIVELSRRQTADLRRIRAVRGLERGDLKRFLPQIGECIQRAIALPEDQLPEKPRQEPKPQLSVLGQFLFSALGSICRQIDLAPGLAGSPSDVRDLIAYRTGSHRRGTPPRLECGWRAEVIGRTFDDLLAGKLSIRIEDPASDHPLVFEPADR